MAHDRRVPSRQIAILGALILTAAALAGAQNPSTANASSHVQTTILGSGSPIVLLGGGLLGADGWGGVPS
jgi:hypothetical protein